MATTSNEILSEAGRDKVHLKEASAVEIISLVDNTVDFLSSSSKEQAKTFRQWSKTHGQLPFAEHGFSMLIRTFNETGIHSILFDAGCSRQGIIKNAKRLGLNLNEVDYIVLSHGHYDHFGGLIAALKAINKTNLPLITHDDMFKPRGTADANGTIRKYPLFPSEEKLGSCHIIKTRKPTLIAEDNVCITGEIPRKTNFETGYPQHRVFSNGTWHPDPWIRDDQAIVISVKGKGLIVVSGCAHAGIINTIRYAQEITGIKRISAVLGGFHLAGKEFEKRIEPTIKELEQVNPELIAPTHCTGWKAACALAKVLPHAFVGNSVGNLYKL
ncbi:MAG: MBL fold metallo-hydrolase [Candidatus Bathyarchaeia archaeon]